MQTGEMLNPTRPTRYTIEATYLDEDQTPVIEVVGEGAARHAGLHPHHPGAHLHIDGLHLPETDTDLYTHLWAENSYVAVYQVSWERGMGYKA